MKALVVSYAFPPVGGAGVQRVLKLVKYLPCYGIEPTVLTVQNPSVPLTDESLAADVSATLPIERARTFEPGYAVKQAAWQSAGSSWGSRSLLQRVARLGRSLLVPDPQILWQPAAALALTRRLVRGEDDVVFISGPPFSQFLLAPLARLSPKTAVVLDYRDEWITYRKSYEMMGRLAAKTGDLLEPLLLARAHLITTATEAFRAELLSRVDFLSPERVVAIPNGYDEADFDRPLPDPPSDRFVVTYAGTVFRLTSARGLLDAVRLLSERSPELARLLELRFIGRIVETELDAFEGMEALGVARVGYVPHGQVIGELSASHLTLCLLADEPGNERVYNAKVFELMRLGRPCLVLAPEGALADLMHAHRAAEVVAPRDVPAIAAALERHLRAFAAGEYRPRSEAIGVERFDRRRLAGEFAAVFRDAHERVTGGALYQVTFWAPRAKRQRPTSAAAFSTTKLRASLARRPPRGPSAARP